MTRRPAHPAAASKHTSATTGNRRQHETGAAAGPQMTNLPLFEEPGASVPGNKAASLSGGQAAARRALYERFAARLSVDERLTRTLVSYQGNRAVPGFRWAKYKEGFSLALVERFLNEHRPREVLDPFAGIATTPLAAAWNGLNGTGIEIMPVGIQVGRGIARAANGASATKLRRAGDALLREVASAERAPARFAFPHVNITKHAFSDAAEAEIAKARRFLAGADDPEVKLLLDLACMTGLEAASFTRKDGQYLRWDYRAGRSLRAKFDVGPIVPFQQALKDRLSDILQDISVFKEMRRRGRPDLLNGSCLELLRQQPTGRFDMVMTSPPYANRYDYTRTYALELAWLGLDQAGFSRLRQSLLTATVENKSKREWLRRIYADDDRILQQACAMHQEQPALQEILSILQEKAEELSNKHVIRLLEGYFFEMAIVIAELGRVVRPGGVVVMVNDNVQYHGEEVPVDFILSDFAEQCGFACADLWMLPRGKGNSSQQMAKFGRREIRKCVYRWVRKND